MVVGQSETDDSELGNFDDSVLGFYSSHIYATGLQNTENIKFKKMFAEKFGADRAIGLLVSPAYDGMHIIYKMIESQKGKPFDGAAAINAVKAIPGKGARGPEADTRDITANVYIR
jgi:branched-chain amino acid transport system substrate-binding protein